MCPTAQVLNKTQAMTDNKTLLQPLFDAMASFTGHEVLTQMQILFAQNCVINMCQPWGQKTGAEGFYSAVYEGLLTAMPDLERRDFIVMQGTCDHGHEWVGCGGNYMGTFVAPWLDIPPTGHLTYMRYHEFYRVEAGQIVEVQAVWDIPEVMLQANAWPMVPALGRNMCIPGPATQDGLRIVSDEQQAQTSKQIVLDMLDALIKHPSQGGPEVMELEKYWQPRMNWYGPACVGTCRGIAGFRNWHQIPFLSAMPDRGQANDELVFNFFGDGAYAAVTGWPNMKQTIKADGWLGIAPAGQVITMSSLDFWRIEDNRIRENWVMFDVLDVYQQLGVNVLARMREFNKVRVPGNVPFPVGDQ